ncbi:MAG: hypothetical protein HYU36_08155 [Planctomycetes bacterium]|nr:hypothetical protein [Planctomycetota bacterium]
MPLHFKPVVEVEQDVYRYEPANNGASPLWCHGSTCLARIGSDVFATGLETLPDQKPLLNCRWMLFHRRDDEKEFHLVCRDLRERTREPSPIACSQDGRFFVSVNPTLTDLTKYSGPARPQVLELTVRDPFAPWKSLSPRWEGEPAFTEHSYRTFTADGSRGELLLLQNTGYDRAWWSFRDSNGEWSACGHVDWPWGGEYVKPQPVRLCYPNVVLADRAVHFFGVSDIVEPNPAWKAYKKEITGREWDFDFRRLFYSWTPDITRQPLHPWIEVASREKTCGWLQMGDLWLAPDGAVHLLWHDRSLDERLRQKFFPGERLTISLEYAVLRDGRKVFQGTLAVSGDGGTGEVPGAGRFQVAEDGRLFVLYAVTLAGGAIENRILEIRPGGHATGPMRIPLAKPFVPMFFTATTRGGSRPSNVIDVLGHGAGDPQTIRYARIRITE